jgi:hypothetical protein
MSFSLSGSANKSKSESASTIDKTTTSTPNAPDWLNAQVQGQSADIGALGQVDPSNYVVGANGLQSQAGQIAGGLGGNAGPVANYDASNSAISQILGLGAPSMKSETLLDGLNSYFNPYQQEVIDTSAADFDHQASLDHAQRGLDIMRSGAFGGSGAALTQSMGDDASQRARASLLSGLRTQGFNTAAGLSGQDADRRQQAGAANLSAASNFIGQQLGAASQLAGNAGAANADQLQRQGSLRDDLSTMFGLGGGLRDIDSQQATAPLDLQAWLDEQYGSIPSSLFVGQTVNEDGTTTTKGKSSGKSVSAGATIPIPF